MNEQRDADMLAIEVPQVLQLLDLAKATFLRRRSGFGYWRVARAWARCSLLKKCRNRLRWSWRPCSGRSAGVLCRGMADSGEAGRASRSWDRPRVRTARPRSWSLWPKSGTSRLTRRSRPFRPYSGVLLRVFAGSVEIDKVQDKRDDKRRSFCWILLRSRVNMPP